MWPPKNLAQVGLGYQRVRVPRAFFDGEFGSEDLPYWLVGRQTAMVNDSISFVSNFD